MDNRTKTNKSAVAWPNWPWRRRIRKPKENPIPIPELFDGSTGRLPEFYVHVAAYMRVHENLFSSDELKVTFVITRLKGQALKRVMPYVSRKSPLLSNYKNFLTEMRLGFGWEEEYDDSAREEYDDYPREEES
ncbi:FAM127A [Sigmodon hispidus]